MSDLGLGTTIFIPDERFKMPAGIKQTLLMVCQARKEFRYALENAKNSPMQADIFQAVADIYQFTGLLNSQRI